MPPDKLELILDRIERVLKTTAVSWYVRKELILDRIESEKGFIGAGSGASLVDLG